MRKRLVVYGLLILAPTLAWLVVFGPRASPGSLSRGQDGLWLRRDLLHGGGSETPAELVARLRRHRITRIYPFLGPPDTAGWPGFVQGRRHHRFDPARAGEAIGRLRALAPELVILPWTGGVLHEQIGLEPGRQRAAWLGHLAALVEAGAQGVHLNIEPLPSGSTAFLELLEVTRAALPAGALVSVAAYPPESPGREAGATEWSLEYLAAVCVAADELVVMGYDTGHQLGLIYETLVARWARQLDETLPAGACRWSMGVPAYEDDVPWHRPEVETQERALSGLRRGLSGGAPADFSGVTLYADWTVDAAEWAHFDATWR